MRPWLGTAQVKVAASYERDSAAGEKKESPLSVSDSFNSFHLMVFEFFWYFSPFTFNHLELHFEYEVKH